MTVIDISKIIHQLEATYSSLPQNEFSGYGFLAMTERGGQKVFDVYDWVLLDVGDWAFTTISARQSMALNTHPSHGDLRMWIHAHPMGNGDTGPHNWSGTDNATIRENPLSGPPELIQWSTSIVRTPLGWVGRFDDHIMKKTAHLEVWPGIKGYIQEARAMKQEKQYAPEQQYYADPSRGLIRPERDEDSHHRSWWDRFRSRISVGKDGDGSYDF